MLEEGAEVGLEVKKTSISDQRESWNALAQMEDSLANESKIHRPGLVRSRVAELEASKGDHLPGRADQNGDWLMAVDTWSWWVAMQ